MRGDVPGGQRGCGASYDRSKRLWACVVIPFRLRLPPTRYKCVQVRTIAAIRRSADTQTAATGVWWAGEGAMTGPVTASERDLRALAGIISDDRADLPAEVGLPPSLLADLMSQIRCDVITFAGFDSGRQETWFLQAIPETRFLRAIPDRGEAMAEHLAPVHWPDYW